MTTETVRKILTRDFILVFFAQVAFTVVGYILIPTLPIYLSRLGSKETEIGVLIGSFGISSLVSRPFVGRALLRGAAKTFMLIGALLFALTSVAYLFAPPFLPFLAVRVFQGIGLALFNTAIFTLVAHISPEIHRGQSLSYFFLAQNISLASAPPLGMLIINHFSFTLLFLVCLGVSSFSLFITSRLGTRRQILQAADSSGEDGAFFNLTALAPSVLSFFFYFIWGALATFFPLHAINHGVTNPGFFYTALSVVLILGRAFGGRILDLYSRERLILYFFSICILSVVTLAFSRTLPWFILAGVIWGIGASFLNPAIMAYTLDRAGNSSRGPAMGTYTACSDLGLSLGPAVMGILIPFTGYPIMFLSLGLVGVITLTYFHFFVKGRPYSDDDGTT
jgi:MFS family permease